MSSPLTMTSRISKIFHWRCVPPHGTALTPDPLIRRSLSRAPDFLCAKGIRMQEERQMTEKTDVYFAERTEFSVLSAALSKRAGGPFLYLMDLCKSSRCSALRSRTLGGGISGTHPLAPSLSKKGGNARNLLIYQRLICEGVSFLFLCAFVPLPLIFYLFS